MEPLTYSQTHIEVIVNEEGDKKRWRFTGFYDNLETYKWKESWELFRNLNSKCDLPWVIIGDFYELLHAIEKEGGNARHEGQMKLFWAITNSCELHDMGYSGSDFTWCRKLGARRWIHERLDKAFFSTNWTIVFPTNKLYHVANSVSDHSILVLKSAKSTGRQKKRTRLFRFESMWLRNKRDSGVVTDAWERGRIMGTN